MRWWSIWALGLVGCLASAPPSRSPVDKDGDGIPDERDLCPEAREDVNGFQDWDGCPEPDADRDGVIDVKDRCPNEPEDRDVFEDEDGCPDPDNDHDRVPDDRDKCPRAPETYNGIDDDDGCPDAGFVGTGPAIRIQPVGFAKNGARIEKDQEPFLDALAAGLIANSFIRLLDVQGHADADEHRPSELSAARAAAVRDALVARKVPKRRLMDTSFGTTRPVCRQPTEPCRALNRRVEFAILERGGSDRDGDGLDDGIDACPNDPEDQDGYQDDDGCPDPDNDRDGFPDALDKCPNEPETKNGIDDGDGCPDIGKVLR